MKSTDVIEFPLSGKVPADQESRPQVAHPVCNTTITLYRHSKPPAPLSISEMKSLLSELDGDSPDLRDVFAIVATIGIRRRELENLRWADVDLVKCQLTVHSSKIKSKRQIPFGPKLMALFQARKNRYPNTEFVLGARPASVMSGVSMKLTKRSKGDFKNPRFTLRLLRHSFLTWLADAGCDTASFCYLAGFSLPRMAIRIFNAGPQVSRGAIQILSAIEQELLGD